jgi:DNA polymerase-3 subunit delta'
VVEPVVDSDLYGQVVGQERAVRNLRAAARSPVHAYLFVGPSGVGMREAARAFAADVLCPDGGCGVCASCRNAGHERHPDLVVIERRGASISKDQIDEIIQLAVRPPSPGSRYKVIVLVDFHLVDQQYAKVLKTIEEPPPSTVFVILAERLPPELVTIASRCVQVDFGPLSVDEVADALSRGGVEPATARELAEASGGRIDRARLLADDPGFAARRALWRSVPSQLDGTGAAVASLADALLSSLDSVLEPLQARHAGEAAELAERIERYGERGSGRRELEDRHKREVRRVRADELRFGMATLAGVYREALVGGSGGGVPVVARSGAVRAIRALDEAAEALVRNPNETLLLQGLLASLTDVAEG